MVRHSGLILVMDVDCYNETRKLSPHAKNKLFYLGIFGSELSRDFEIRDPLGLSSGEFKDVFTHIMRSIDSLVKVLDEVYHNN